MQIDGVGPLTATIIWAIITDTSLFKNGRGVAAMLGLVPRQCSSGNKTILKGISKRGDRYTRTLLIHGARTVLKTVALHQTRKHQWIKNKMARCGFNKTAVAVANKHARIIWAMMHYGSDYQPNHVPERYRPKGIQPITHTDANAPV